MKIIAEAGVNHNGDLKTALELVERAKIVGADYVKFQRFKASDVVTKNAGKAEYQIANTNKNETQESMLRSLELSDDSFEIINEKCKEVDIGFLASGFCPDDFQFLKHFKMDYLKIPSGEINNLPLLEEVSKQVGKSRIILSTGMSGLSDIENAVSILINNQVKRKQITLLHCTTEYPAPYDSINLTAIKTMGKAFKCEIGYSDHSCGIHIGIAAVALGATILEKHFTLDKTQDGPDHAASLNPEEFGCMVDQIRDVEKSMGDGIKQITSCEKNNILIARKSLVALTEIAKGEVFTKENLGCKRPGNGISPMRYYDYIGKESSCDLKKDELIK